MGSKAPTPGRCGHRQQNGSYCTSEPGPGLRRCGRHNYDPGARGLMARFKGLSREGLDAVTSYIAHDDLLDHRRAVALHLLVMEGVPFEPTPEQVERLALARALDRFDKRSRDATPDDRAAVVPTDADRQAIRDAMMSAAQKAILNHADLVNAAARVEDARAVMRSEALPVILDFAKALAVLMRRFVPIDRQAEFVAELRGELARATARLGRVEHDIVRDARRVVSSHAED